MMRPIPSTPVPISSPSTLGLSLIRTIGLGIVLRLIN